MTTPDYEGLVERLREWRAGSHPVWDGGRQTGEYVDEAKDFNTLQKEREEAADAIEALQRQCRAAADEVGANRDLAGKWQEAEARIKELEEAARDVQVMMRQLTGTNEDKISRRVATALQQRRQVMSDDRLQEIREKWGREGWMTSTDTDFLLDEVVRLLSEIERRDRVIEAARQAVPHLRADGAGDYRYAFLLQALQELDERGGK